MRFTCLLIPLLLSATVSLAQKLEDGLWNAGRANSVTVLNNPALVMQNQLSMVKLFQGFAVVRTVYDFQCLSADSIRATFTWPDTISTPHRFFRQIHNLPSAMRTVIFQGDTLQAQAINDSGRWQLHLGPQQVYKLETVEICPTNQAKLFADGSMREKNAFVFSFGSSGGNNRRVFIELTGNLSLNNMIGIYPSSVESNLQRLRWQADSVQTELVIWYDGAAPDYNFEKKVLPKSALLFEDIRQFDLALFDAPGFQNPDKTDFSTNKRSMLGTILYFALFSIPWLILLVFIVFLIRKPKKRS